MITINSISGGKTSAYIASQYPADYEIFACVCVDDPECAPQDKAIIEYANRKLEKFIPERGEFVATAEDDQTLRAMMDLEQYIGREIIWVRGKSFDQILNEPSFFGGKPSRLPSWARRYCTLEMKLLPIFIWWFYNVGERCDMRIGFRFDEYKRMERFMNDADPCNFKIPVSCSLRGERRQKHEDFNWRYCSFPLIRDSITSQNVKEFWKNKSVGGNLFEEIREIKFPEISNCVGCFHKKVETLSVMASMHPIKMKWFSSQEENGMGTWLDSKVKYEEIIANSKNWIPEMIKEVGACDSGGCHD